jgi:hypothetical protein
LDYGIPANIANDLGPFFLSAINLTVAEKITAAIALTP